MRLTCTFYIRHFWFVCVVKARFLKGTEDDSVSDTQGKGDVPFWLIVIFILVFFFGAFLCERARAAAERAAAIRKHEDKRAQAMLEFNLLLNLKRTMAEQFRSVDMGPVPINGKYSTKFKKQRQTFMQLQFRLSAYNGWAVTGEGHGQCGIFVITEGFLRPDGAIYWVEDYDQVHRRLIQGSWCFDSPAVKKNARFIATDGTRGVLVRFRLQEESGVQPSLSSEQSFFDELPQSEAVLEEDEPLTESYPGDIVAENNFDAECPICLENLTVRSLVENETRPPTSDHSSPFERQRLDGLPVRLPSCGHTFCASCLYQWVQRTSSATCPVCRQPVCHLPTQRNGLSRRRGASP